LSEHSIKNTLDAKYEHGMVQLKLASTCEALFLSGMQRKTGTYLHASTLHASTLHASTLHATMMLVMLTNLAASLHAASLHAASLHAASLHAASLHASHTHTTALLSTIALLSTKPCKKQTPHPNGRFYTSAGEG